MSVHCEAAMRRTPSRWPTPAIWETHRARISSLYQHNTLQEVRKIMASKYNFHATLRMYRTRLSAWGQDKNNKMHEMQTIAVEAQQSHLNGFQPIFLVRGKVITSDSVRRYFQRKKMTVDGAISATGQPRGQSAGHYGEADSFEQSTNATSPPSESTCSARTSTSDESIWAEPLSPARALSTPPVLAIPEHAIRKTIDYVLGSFDSQVWKSSVDTGQFLVGRCPTSTPPCKLYDDMNNLHCQARLACDLFDQQRFEDGGIFLAASTMGIGELAKAAWPPMPTYLPHTLHSILVRRKPEVAIAILRHFARFIALFHGVEHPMYQFCLALVSVESNHLLEAVRSILAAVHNSFAAKLGNLHRTTLAARYAYARTLWWSNGPVAFVSEIRDIVEECQTQLRATDVRTVTFRLHLARWILNPLTSSSIPDCLEAGQILADERARLIPTALDAEDIVRFITTHGSSFVSQYKLCTRDAVDAHATKTCHCAGTLSYIDHACDADDLFWPKLYLREGSLESSGEGSHTRVLHHVHRRPSPLCRHE